MATRPRDARGRFARTSPTRRRSIGDDEDASVNALMGVIADLTARVVRCEASKIVAERQATDSAVALDELRSSVNLLDAKLGRTVQRLATVHNELEVQSRRADASATTLRDLAAAKGKGRASPPGKPPSTPASCPSCDSEADESDGSTDESEPAPSEASAG